jgi:hypothetical protein
MLRCLSKKATRRTELGIGNWPGGVFADFRIRTNCVTAMNEPKTVESRGLRGLATDPSSKLGDLLPIFHSALEV